jgi:aminoglycoside phosphotransferase family enzyme/predicted kinase
VTAAPPPPEPTEKPSAWPPAVTETHISTLVFAGDRAYKRKKPVRFGFLDFSTPELRRAACRREVELNRRLAPDVYLGVADLLDEHGRSEPLVVMRRMDPAVRLAALVAAGDPGLSGHLDALATRLATFHRHGERSAAIDDAARADAVRGVWDDSTREMAPSVGPVLDAGVVADVTDRYRRFCDHRGDLFDDRIAAGFVCDGHGDLQADDVFCYPDGPRVLDCIEFDDRLRHGDVLADVAFLAMDLERLGDPAAGGRLVGSWAQAYGDPAVLDGSLLQFYVAARAHVRAKVACLRHAQCPPGSQAAFDAARSAQALMALCRRHLVLATARVVMVGGAPGTGKTTLAEALGEATGWPVVHSDVVRKELAGLAPTERRGDGTDTGLYDPAAVAATYAEVRRRAAGWLAAGRSVVCDASWSRVHERAATRAVAADLGADVVELRCVTEAAVAHRRVAQRLAAGDAAGVAGASDATVEVADVLAARFEDWPEATALDTTGAVVTVMAAALAAIGPAAGDVGPGPAAAGG